MIYEREEHRVAQRLLVEDCARTFGCVPWHLSTLRPIDAWLVRAKAVVGTLEVKCRDANQFTYPTCWVEVRKVDALLRLTPDERRAVFAVRWNDATGWVRAVVAATFPQRRVSLNVPRDAGDVNDLIYDVPTHLFLPLPVRGRVVVAADDWSLT